MAMAYDEACRLLQGERLPAVLVDLGAFERNLERHGRAVAASGLKIRFATKSIRVVSLVERVLAAPFAQGLMCFSVAEAAALAARGLDDLFIAYPTLQLSAFETLAELSEKDKNVSVAVDSAEGVERIAGVSKRRGVPLRIVLCTDMSLRAGKGRVHVGVRRSP
ncbi:MAG: amino acid deaminase/aldolase, partial [Polyangiaceae bacterium]|nr:amino acid deaminase/aldolase [Polyangiaceae bacterium]